MRLRELCDRLNEKKDVPGMEGLCAVTRNGRVWRYASGSFKKSRWVTETNCVGYGLVCVGHKKYQLVHRLVAMTYIGPPTEEKPHINHKDGNKKNNWPENLEWTSHSDNIRHAWRMGFVKLPKKVKKKHILLVRKLRASGKTYYQIEAETGLGHSTAYRIIQKTHGYL